MALNTASQELSRQLAAAPPNPPPRELPAVIVRQADVVVGLMITAGAIVAVIALVSAFILLMIGDEQRGHAGGKIMKVLAGTGGIMAAGSLVGLLWAA